jgi:hypothetical protein
VPGNRFREESIVLNQSRGSYPLVYIKTVKIAFKITCINISYSIQLSSEICKLFDNVVFTVHVYHAIVYKLAQHYAHTYTVKLYSYVSMAVTIIIRGEKPPDQKKRRFFKVSDLSHIAIFRVSLHHRAVY